MLKLSMAAHTFTTYLEATVFAKQIAIENNRTVKVVRSGDVYVVCVDASMTSTSTDVSTQRKPNSTPLTRKTNSVPDGKNAASSPVSVTSRKNVKKKQQRVGLSAAAAKHSAADKNKKNIDPRSIFITKDIEPRVISGGLPSIGKRK